MENSIYKLKADVSISEFSGISNDEYLIRYHDHNWKISGLVYEVILRLDSEIENETIINEINEKFKIKIGQETIEKVVDFLKKNSLLEGIEEIPERGTRLGQKNIWGRITIITPRMIKKLFFLSFAYNPFFMTVTAFLGVSSVIYLLIVNNPKSVGRILFDLPLSQLILCGTIGFSIGLFHELGHSAALMRYGGEPKRIGVAVYFFMPVFFSDVTSAWQLKQKHRIVVDLGGLYFQSMIIAVLTIINFKINSSVIKYAVIISASSFFSNLVPFFKMDGYWVLCDYLGITNIWKACTEHLKYKLKKSKKRSEISRLQSFKKFIFYIFILFSCIYFLYFGTFFWSSMKYNIEIFVNDIKIFVDEKNMILNSLSFESVLRYIFKRITSIIFMIFLVRMIVNLLKKIHKIRFKTKGDNSDH